jgi:protoporphyrinogen oxidase
VKNWRESLRGEEGSFIVGIGAGISGLTAAWKLAETFGDRVILLEREDYVGGLAATIRRNGFSVDIGSHRLHEDCAEEEGSLIEDLVGAELLRRPRNGKIYLGGHGLPYPPRSLDMLTAFGLPLLFHFGRDLLLAKIKQRMNSKIPVTFEEFATLKVGRSLYEHFYRPYAIKLYGICPSSLSADPPANRVRSFSVRSPLKRRLTGGMMPRRQTYLYPASGIGRLADCLKERFLKCGGRLDLRAKVEGFVYERDRSIREIRFRSRDGQLQSLRTNIVFSSIPLKELSWLIASSDRGMQLPPLDLRWRNLRLLHIVTSDRIPRNHETYYFPEPDITFGRVSELNKYSQQLNQDPDRAVLTIEIPCNEDDDVWKISEERLAGICIPQLQRFGILRVPLTRNPEYFSMGIENAYPLFDLGYRQSCERIIESLNTCQNLYVFGRSALYLHCNIDHCIHMGIELGRFLTSRDRAKKKWDEVQNGFNSFRVRE